MKIPNAIKDKFSQSTFQQGGFSPLPNADKISFSSSFELPLFVVLREGGLQIFFKAFSNSVGVSATTKPTPRLLNALLIFLCALSALFSKNSLCGFLPLRQNPLH
jgi:hypothetical protein